MSLLTKRTSSGSACDGHYVKRPWPYFVSSQRFPTRRTTRPPAMATALPPFAAAFSPPFAAGDAKSRRRGGSEFPSFLPKEVAEIRDPFARNLAKRIERMPVKLSSSETSIMSSFVRPLKQGDGNPVVLLHGFDGSCLQWRYTYPLLEKAHLETWALDILGWGFCDLVYLFKETRPSCDVTAKRKHLYELWRAYINRPMVLVGPSLGAAVAIDFAYNYPEAVEKLVLLDASVYAEGTESMAKFPKFVSYAGVALLKSVPLRLYANYLAFNKISFPSSYDSMKVGRLHCLLPWWEDATVDFMGNGGYMVTSLIKKIKQDTLIIWGENDQIVSNKFAQQLHEDLPSSTLIQIPECGHLPHVEKPDCVAKLIVEFSTRDSTQKKIEEPMNGSITGTGPDQLVPGSLLDSKDSLQ